MTFRTAALVAAVTAIVLSPVTAGSHHPLAAVAAPIPKALGIPVGGSSAGAGLAVGVIAAAAVLIIVHEIKRKRCDMRHFVFVDNRPENYVGQKPWRDPCVKKSKHKQKPIRARG